MSTNFLPRSKVINLVVITAIISIISGAALAYFFSQPSTKTQIVSYTNQVSPTATLTSSTQPTSQTLKQTGSQIIPLDSTYDQYNNYDIGFTVKFPKMPISNSSCFDGDTSLIPHPTQVIEDINNKIIYIAEKETPIFRMDRTCSIKNVTLDMIKNGVNGNSGAGIFNQKPASYMIKFATVTTDKSIINFVTQTYFNKDVSSQFP